MRFEFSGNDVVAIIKMMYGFLEDSRMIDPMYIGFAERIYRKLKFYAAEAFGNREAFRNEMKNIEQKIEETRTKWFGNHFTKVEDKNANEKRKNSN